MLTSLLIFGILLLLELKMLLLQNSSHLKWTLCSSVRFHGCVVVVHQFYLLTDLLWLLGLQLFGFFKIFFHQVLIVVDEVLRYFVCLLRFWAEFLVEVFVVALDHIS